MQKETKMRAPRIPRYTEGSFDRTPRKQSAAVRSVTPQDGESVTDTSFGNDTDINNIVARCTRDGLWPPIPDDEIFADVAGLQKPLAELIDESRKAIEAYNEAEATQSEREQQQITKDQLERYEALEKRLEAIEKTGVAKTENTD